MNRSYWLLATAVAAAVGAVTDFYAVEVWLLSIGFALVLAAGLKTAIRNRSFGVLGFSDLLLRKPAAAKLDQFEVRLISMGVGTITGALLSIFLALFFGI